ncbi:MAG: iron ABC transporter permease [Candidatus Omnitrophica bacterium]|nr:iron ABC transporter permease [Candidatus Omnitrophota bacterium]MBU4488384.1 iron ABC transporter permease [Candidatus Omnitrophota bacterium]MCG2705019.1 iron ABC transporter permease [Candidatus Omnitrophota bacterium]
MNKTPERKIWFLFLILAFAVFLGITKGSVGIPFLELFSEANRPILHLRLLRIFLAAIAASGLAVSGAALQAILRNPLAEPYLLGTSSGAGLGAVLGIIMGIQGLWLPLAAFLGATLSFILVYNLAREGNKVPVQSLILAGVVVSIALSGILVFAISISPNEALHGIMWWLWGSMHVYDTKLICVVSIIVIAGIAAMYMFSQDLNAISIGEEEAVHLGINTEAVKKIVFLLTSLVTASVVSICGIIGFVGLIIPHMMRFIVGPAHRRLIPATCLAAASFMIICDMLSRSLMPPMEIPIGVITALVGAPIFIILLRTRQGMR